MRSRSFRRLLASKFAREDDAASLAEYALLLGVVAVALAVAVSQLSGSLSNLFARTTNSMGQVSAESGTSGGAVGGDPGTGTGTGNGTGTGTGNGVNGNGGGQGNGQGNNGNGNGNSGNNGKKP